MSEKADQKWLYHSVIFVCCSYGIFQRTSVILNLVNIAMQYLLSKHFEEVSHVSFDIWF